MADNAYTLPVWVAAASLAALQQLRGEVFMPEQPLELQGDGPATQQDLVPVVAAAPLGEGRALAVARCEPGEGLDLTRGLVVWVEASWQPTDPAGDWLVLQAGEGVGVHAHSRELCLSAYARWLLEHNLRPQVPAGRGLALRIVFPTGRALAERTSNAAFGVVDGLALIGTQAEVQRSADPDQLRRCLAALDSLVGAQGFGGDLVLVIGENGLDLAPRLGLPQNLLLKGGNWVGPVLVAAAERGVRRLLLFGYHGKLIKLAGGIFHTHHHLADGRAEVLTALAALEGVVGEDLRQLHGAPTVEAALAALGASEPERAEALRRRMAAAIEQRSAAYVARYGVPALVIGAVLFDRSRRVTAQGPLGAELWRDLGAGIANGSRHLG
ncbi:MAG: cobalt-precorrin-5B (C(1))-methyltransferase CbiD [Synechococcaceae cyanobacterium ELA445]|jgi:cobalt-precorrin-5B (C1)-methyltransferase